MARRLIGLDVGTFSVKVAHLEARTRATDFDVVAYAEIPLSTFEKEGSEKSEKDLQIEALLELKKLGYLEGSYLATGLAAAEAQIRSLNVPFDNPKKIEAVLGGLLDAHLPFSIDNLVYSWFPVSKLEQTKILVGFSRQESIAGFLGQLHKAEVDPRYLTLKASALYDLLSQLIPSETQNEALHVVVDIGHKSTGICVGDKSQMLFARSVSRGSFHVSEAIAQKKGMTFADAENLKITAKELSDDLQEAFYPIARELRQTILAIEAESHKKVERIFLVGGGSKVVGLDQFLSGLLMAPVSLVNRFPHFHYGTAKEALPRSMKAPSTEAGLALSYAVYCDRIAKKAPRFNLRKEEYAYSGELNFMRQRAKALASWSAVIILLLFLFGGFRNTIFSFELADLKTKQQDLCLLITGQKSDSASKCLAIIQEVITGQGNFGVPAMSAVDVYIELAKAIPKDVKIKITDLNIADQKVNFSAETSNFDAVDQVVAALNQSRCMSKVEKSKTRQVQSGAIQFQINFDVDCQKMSDAPMLTLLQDSKVN